MVNRSAKIDKTVHNQVQKMWHKDRQIDRTTEVLLDQDCSKTLDTKIKNIKKKFHSDYFQNTEETENFIHNCM